MLGKRDSEKNNVFFVVVRVQIVTSLSVAPQWGVDSGCESRDVMLTSRAGMLSSGNRGKH